MLAGAALLCLFPTGLGLVVMLGDLADGDSGQFDGLGVALGGLFAVAGGVGLVLALALSVATVKGRTRAAAGRPRLLRGSAWTCVVLAVLGGPVAAVAMLALDGRLIDSLFWLVWSIPFGLPAAAVLVTLPAQTATRAGSADRAPAH
ncbi:hypothetical protein GCM10027026_36390 [Myroides odoratimimus subsp. xuanwuensis]